jgi:putative SOS response-associated peptidase YedK
VCGRYQLHTHPAAIALAFGIAHPIAYEARYNIAPMTEVPVVRVNAHGERELVRLRWGLVPRWARDPSIGSHMINARAETLAEKQSFRIAYRRHRCLLPADGFYEWMSLGGDSPHKQPVHIGLRDGRPFGLAGLFERWLSPEGEVLDTCTIVTTRANALLAAVHDRMPVIIPPEAYARWLDPANSEVEDLIVPFPSERMTFHPVSSRVNTPRNDDAALLERVELPPEAEAHEPPPHVPEQESLF